MKSLEGLFIIYRYLVFVIEWQELNRKQKSPANKVYKAFKAVIPLGLEPRALTLKVLCSTN